MATNFGNARRLHTIGDGTAVTNTTTETTTLSLTIPGYLLVAGSRVDLRAIGTAPNTNSTDTANVKLKLGSVVHGSTGAVDVADNDDFVVTACIYVQTAGAASTAEVHSDGRGRWTTSGATDSVTVTVDNTSVGTASDITVACTITWSVANAGNSALGKALEAIIYPPQA